MYSVSHESHSHPSHFSNPQQDQHDYNNMASPPHRQQYPMMPQAHFQPAPRQRTAIACRYCRRRKIRCSGFETSPDARCSNCVRFHQDCVFTPVSSQAQAFVPVHAIHSHLRDPSQIGPDGQYPQMVYGAHGQPLGHVTIQSPYPPQDPNYRLPPPNAGPHSPSTMPGPGYYDPGYEAHRASMHLPPVQTSQSSTYPPIVPRPHSTEQPYGESPYPPPPPGAYYQGGQYYPPPPGPGPGPAPGPAPAPAQAYAQSNGDRSSSSPHSSVPSVNYQYNLHPPQGQPPHQPPSPAPQGAAAQAPPAGGPTSPRAGMSISNILDGGKPGGSNRSAADNDMVNALNRKAA